MTSLLKSCYLFVKIRWNWVAVNTLKTCIPNASSSRGPFKYVAKTMTECLQYEGDTPTSSTTTAEDIITASKTGRALLSTVAHSVGLSVQSATTANLSPRLDGMMSTTTFSYTASTLGMGFETNLTGATTTETPLVSSQSNAVFYVLLAFMLLALFLLALTHIPRLFRWVNVHFHVGNFVAEPVEPPTRPFRRPRPEINILNVHPPLQRSTSSAQDQNQDIEIRTIRRTSEDEDDTAL